MCRSYCGVLCIPLMTNEVELLFYVLVSHSCISHISLVKYLLKSFIHFFSWLYIFVFIYISHLYIFWIQILYHGYDLQNF